MKNYPQSYKGADAALRSSFSLMARNVLWRVHIPPKKVRRAPDNLLVTR